MQLPEAFAFAVVFSVPLVALLTRHQQRMAEILHRRNQEAPTVHDPLLMQQLTELRELVVQQSLQIDDLSRRHDALVRRLGASDRLEDRLNA